MGDCRGKVLPGDGSHLMKSLTIASAVFPVPIDRGDALRVAALLDALSAESKFAGWAKTLVLARRPDTTAEDIAALQTRYPGFNVVCTSASLLLGHGRPARATRWLLSILLLTPNGILEKAPARFVRARRDFGSADLLWILGEGGARRLSADEARFVVWDKANVLGASMTSMWANRAIRTVLGVAAARAFERRILRHVHKVVVTSADEADRLRSLYGRSADAIVASGVQLPTITKAERREGVGWMSSFNYGPNVDGLRAFLEQAWPVLAAEGHHLWIAGAGDPPADLKVRMERDPTITFSGFVSDLDTWMSEREVAVVPVWAGAGVKLKTLTWLASETPVISTGAGIEGISARDGESVLVASTPASFASRVAEFYRMTMEDRERLGRSGRRLAERDFGAEALSSEYVREVASWVDA